MKKKYFLIVALFFAKSQVSSEDIQLFINIPEELHVKSGIYKDIIVFDSNPKPNYEIISLDLYLKDSKTLTRIDPSWILERDHTFFKNDGMSISIWNPYADLEEGKMYYFVADVITNTGMNYTKEVLFKSIFEENNVGVDLSGSDGTSCRCDKAMYKYKEGIHSADGNLEFKLYSTCPKRAESNKKRLGPGFDNTPTTMSSRYCWEFCAIVEQIPGSGEPVTPGGVADQCGESQGLKVTIWKKKFGENETIVCLAVNPNGRLTTTRVDGNNGAAFLANNPGATIHCADASVQPASTTSTFAPDGYTGPSTVRDLSGGGVDRIKKEHNGNIIHWIDSPGPNFIRKRNLESFKYKAIFENRITGTSGRVKDNCLCHAEQTMEIKMNQAGELLSHTENFKPLNCEPPEEIALLC
jgi:hypothetical protein